MTGSKDSLIRILAVSDMHGNLDPVRELLQSRKPDILVCCGDWGDPGQVTHGEFEDIISSVHVLTVFGNHDDIDLLRFLKNRDGSPILLENGVMREVMDVRFGGISGIWAKSHRNPWYITDDEIKSMGRFLKADLVDILLTHGCALGICDWVPGGRHGGHRSFLDAILTIKPKAAFCGHLHRQQVRTFADGRIAANVGHTALGDYIVIERHNGSWTLQSGRIEREGYVPLPQPTLADGS